MDDAPLPALFVLNRSGEPVREPSRERWERWYARLERRRIAATSLGRGAFVSTLFLGVDRGDGNLFHTIHFQSGTAVEVVLYATRQDALIGHDRVVERARGEGGTC